MIDALFTRVEGHDLYSGVFQAHSMRVLGGLNMVISILDNKEGILDACLMHLRAQHTARGIPKNYFQVRIRCLTGELTMLKMEQY